MYSLALLGIYFAHQQLEGINETKFALQTFMDQETDKGQIESFYQDDIFHTHDFAQKEEKLEKIYVFDWLFEFCKGFTSMIHNAMYKLFNSIF